MWCAISQRIPQEPVVSKVNGYLFERRLIEKYIDEHGTCPVTGVPLRREDLVAVQSAAPGATSAPAALAVAGVPQLLSQLQSEWEAAALEQFALRQRVGELEREVAHAVQRCEAAYRVIATLTSGAEDAAAEEVSAAEVPAAVLRAIAAQEEEQRRRRKRPHSGGAAESGGAATSDVSPGAAARVAAVLARAEGRARCVGRGGSRRLCAAGEGDCALVEYDAATGQRRGVGRGHTGLVHTCTALHSSDNNNTNSSNNSSNSSDGEEGETVWLSGSADGTVRVWRGAAEGALRCEQTLRPGDGVCALSRRTIAARYAVSGGMRGVVSVADVERGEVVARGENNNNKGDSERAAVAALELHPYGTMAVVADVEGGLDVWDVRLMRPDTALQSRRAGAHAVVHGAAFSPDCVTLATSLGDGAVRVYDLRHTAQPLLTLAGGDGAAAALAFAPAQSFASAAALVVGRVGGLALYDPRRAAEAARLWIAADLVGGATYDVCLVGAAQRRIAACTSDGIVRLYDLREETHTRG